MRSSGQCVLLCTGLALFAGAGCTTDEAVIASANVSPALGAMQEPEFDGDLDAAIEELFGGSRTCYSIRGSYESGDEYKVGGLLRLDLDSETATLVPGFEAIRDFGVNSMAHFGSSILSCNEQSGAISIYNLRSKKTEKIAADCQSIAGDGRHIWMLTSGRREGAREAVIQEFNGLTALREARVSRTIPAPPTISRVGVGDNRLLTAWHSTSEVVEVDLLSGAATPSTLENFDGWILGMSEAFGHRYIAGYFSEEDRGIHVFDLKSGANKGRIFTDYAFGGLTCDSRR
jgi:hypothetical protein